ncbi:MAG: hypothetical protein A2X81_12100 [Desulfobacterales bacterium GWB2_56_26]|nr:MAG: hypothetical protein A2X81_12100 [Desulfobacterales bacterium GWB2_56_26]
MASLNDSPVIWTLAKDLGIKKISNPVEEILNFCEKKVKKILKEFTDCNTLQGLLEAIAAKMNTQFCEIRDDNELETTKKRFVSRGEKIFANLDSELNDEVLGITFKLTNREPWERQFVSVIDCRGSKAFRSYFTKWHEIAHLLVLTDQQRLKFMRTNTNPAKIDPEEVMVDKIAGRFGFYPSFIRKKVKKHDLTFEIIEMLKFELCPEASVKAALIGFVNAWPGPCILAYCKLGLKKSEQRNLSQQSFGFMAEPMARLRAIEIVLNPAATKASFRIHKNMRVPNSSVIKYFYENFEEFAEAEENLSWWESSDGKRLGDIPIAVKVRRYSEGVFALISPL